MPTNLQSEIIDLGEDNPVEIAMVIDVSGSMGQNSKLGQTQVAASKLAKLMRLEKDSLGICSFNTAGNLEWPEGNNHKVKLLADRSVQTDAIASIHKLQAGGGTDMLPGLNLAKDMFTEAVSNKAVILLSDGLDGHGGVTQEKQIASDLNTAGKEVYTIAVGNDADTALLEDLAGSPDRYNLVTDAFAANNVFHEIIDQLGIAKVLMNEIQEISADKFLGGVYPKAQADHKVPTGKTEVAIAAAWDKLDVTCKGVNTALNAPLQAKEISLTIGKVNGSGSLEPPTGTLTKLHEEPGLWIGKLDGVSADEQYGVEMEKSYTSNEAIRLSVGVFA